MSTIYTSPYSSFTTELPSTPPPSPVVDAIVELPTDSLSSSALSPSSSNAVAVRPHSSINLLKVVLQDPYLTTIFFGAINSRVTEYNISPLDVTVDLDLGVTSFLLDERLADSAWLAVVKLAQIVQCAGNQHNPYDLKGAPLPLTIPDAAFRSIDTEPILLPITLLTPTVNPLRQKYSSYQALLDQFALVQKTVLAHIAWMAIAIHRSLAQGPRSLWSWGSYFGIGWGEFLERVSGVHDVHSVRTPMPTIEEPYDLTSIENRVALVLHPTMSEAMISYNAREARAADIYEGRIQLADFSEREKYLIRVIGLATNQGLFITYN
ncbi:hypothetical protein GALMADRAFT_146764 [Galerina marginata CBS 339.88]|uniref:Uncharacterized protein n=1 Tax=Galerina marginata (strain CBS 339.88) TaxID=685588 RepID=A0A067SK05_GALM3|nr:hypothetical protein GALMADRAFT_146764 [Galerina marginata CBS 339.88]